MKKQEKLYSLFSMSLLIVAGTAFAAPSLPIPDVVGHKPTVDNVRIDKVPPVTGDTLNILYDYQDIVGDIDASTPVNMRPRQGEAFCKAKEIGEDM